MPLNLRALCLSLLLVSISCSSRRLARLEVRAIAAPVDAGAAGLLPGLGGSVPDLDAGGEVMSPDRGGMASGGQGGNTSGQALSLDDAGIPVPAANGGQAGMPGTPNTGGQAGTPPACEDDALGTLETDVDCGGNCSGCADGLGCLVDDDCMNGQCDALTSTCISCLDGITNGNETNLDCGGTDCEPCGSPEPCTGDAACGEGNVCSATGCTACGNGALDPGEICDPALQPGTCTPSCLAVCVQGCTCLSSTVAGTPNSYAFCPSSAMWSDAQASCQTAGFQLVRADDAAELAFVQQQANARSLGVYWHGASDLAQENAFVWTNGDPVVTPFWNPGEPNGGTNENCVSSFGTIGTWSDSVCTSFFAYVCERPD